MKTRAGFIFNASSKLFYVWLPIAFILFQAGLEITYSRDVLAPLHSEGGPHEMLQFLMMAAAFFVAVWIFFSIKGWRPWLRIWVGIAALACLYIAGEEISWGQHFLSWTTPEYWAAINDQGETNLHNTSSWLDQKPRLILLLGVIVGGLVIPLLHRFKSSLLPQQFVIIYPPSGLWLTALFALGVNLTDKITDALLGGSIFTRSSEVEELYLFYFVLVYLVDLSRRLTQHQR